LEVCAEFIISEHITGFELLRNHYGKGVKIYFDPMEQNIVVDMKSVSRISNDGHLFNGKYVSSLPQILRPGEKMKLHVFLDRSILDIFINDRWASSVRIFPTNEIATGTSFYTTGETHVERLEAYIMGDGYFPAPEMVDVENITTKENGNSATKLLENGQVFICKDGKKYTLLGMKIN
jgi:beta-fructofuranosidase